MSEASVALDEGRAYRSRPASDLLVLEGPDGTDLLQRISATELRDVEPGDTRALALTDDKGRLVDLPRAHRADAWWLLAGAGRGLDLMRWIDRWIIMEDARIAPAKGRRAFDLLGQTAMETAMTAIGGTAHTTPPPLPVLIHAPVGPIRATLLVDEGEAETVQSRLAATLVEVDDDSVGAWCAARGIVRPGPGLDAGCHPLELGFAEHVSFTKGCYLGQEVIARLDTYDKVRRRVAVVSTPTHVAPGTVIRHGGKKVGVVFEAGQDTAVAVVDRFVEPGTALELENAGAGTLVRIPAPETA